MDQFSSNGLVSQLIGYNVSLGTNWIQSHRVTMVTQIMEASKLILPRNFHLKST